MPQTTRERPWLTHHRREPWVICPLCGAPIQWRKTDVDGWVPCDQTPVLYVQGGRLRLVKRRDLVPGCAVYRPVQHSGHPQYAWMPHYYTCQVLRKERTQWAYEKRERRQHAETAFDQQGGRSGPEYQH